MTENKIMDNLLIGLKEKFTTEVNEKTANRIEAVTELCHELGIKASDETGQPNHSFAKMIGQNKAVMDDFGTGFWLAKKASRVESEKVEDSE